MVFQDADLEASRQWAIANDAKTVPMKEGYRPCKKCGKPANKICGGCHLTPYCSVECQKAHFDAHQARCKEVSQDVRTDELPELVALANDVKEFEAAVAAELESSDVAQPLPGGRRKPPVAPTRQSVRWKEPRFIEKRAEQHKVRSERIEKVRRSGVVLTERLGGALIDFRNFFSGSVNPCTPEDSFVVAKKLSGDHRSLTTLNKAVGLAPQVAGLSAPDARLSTVIESVDSLHGMFAVLHDAAGDLKNSALEAIWNVLRWAKKFVLGTAKWFVGLAEGIKNLVRASFAPVWDSLHKFADAAMYVAQSVAAAFSNLVADAIAALIQAATRAAFGDESVVPMDVDVGSRDPSRELPEASPDAPLVEPSGHRLRKGAQVMKRLVRAPPLEPPAPPLEPPAPPLEPPAGQADTDAVALRNRKLALRQLLSVPMAFVLLATKVPQLLDMINRGIDAAVASVWGSVVDVFRSLFGSAESRKALDGALGEAAPRELSAPLFELPLPKDLPSDEDEDEDEDEPPPPEPAGAAGGRGYVARFLAFAWWLLSKAANLVGGFIVGVFKALKYFLETCWSKTQLAFKTLFGLRDGEKEVVASLRALAKSVAAHGRGDNSNVLLANLADVETAFGVYSQRKAAANQLAVARQASPHQPEALFKSAYSSSRCALAVAQALAFAGSDRRYWDVLVSEAESYAIDSTCDEALTSLESEGLLRVQNQFLDVVLEKLNVPGPLPDALASELAKTRTVVDGVRRANDVVLANRGPSGIPFRTAIVSAKAFTTVSMVLFYSVDGPAKLSAAFKTIFGGGAPPQPPSAPELPSPEPESEPSSPLVRLSHMPAEQRLPVKYVAYAWKASAKTLSDAPTPEQWTALSSFSQEPGALTWTRLCEALPGGRDGVMRALMLPSPTSDDIGAALSLAESPGAVSRMAFFHHLITSAGAWVRDAGVDLATIKSSAGESFVAYARSWWERSQTDTFVTGVTNAFSAMLGKAQDSWSEVTVTILADGADVTAVPAGVPKQAWGSGGFPHKTATPADPWALLGVTSKSVASVVAGFLPLSKLPINPAVLFGLFAAREALGHNWMQCGLYLFMLAVGAAIGVGGGATVGLPLTVACSAVHGLMVLGRVDKWSWLISGAWVLAWNLLSN